MDQKRWLFARIFVRRFRLRQRLKANSQIFAYALVTISGLVDSFRRKKRIATKTRGVFRNSISKISVEDYRRIENPWLFHAFTFPGLSQFFRGSGREIHAVFQGFD